MRVLVYTIQLGDVEDPEIYAAEPIYAWEHSEQGQWLHENSYQRMVYTINPSPNFYGTQVCIWAWLHETALTYFTLRWGKPNGKL